MMSLEVGFVGLGCGLLLIAMRIPIGVALGSVAFFGIAVILNFKAAWGIITAVPYNFVGDWNLTAVPMFLFMGYIASTTGLTGGLFQAARALLSWIPGGLAVASVFACAVFAAASGSSVATAAAMARIATPEMLRHKYDAGLASGVVAASGTLGSLIPPSILMILYGYFSGVSIGKLFIAGVIPGLISALIYAVMIVVRVKLKPSLAPAVTETEDAKSIREHLKDVWPLPTLIMVVLLGIFLGIFTPTEAGAFGAAFSILIAYIKKSVTWVRLKMAIFQTLSGTAGVFMVAMGTITLTRFMALSGLPDFITASLLSISSDGLFIILMIAILYFILGMFVDSIGLLLLTLPIVLPVVREAGLDLVWFGIIVIKLLEIGLVTPPVGLNVYVIKGALGSRVELQTIFRGVAWFVAMDFVALALIVAFPILALFLPNLMY